MQRAQNQMQRFLLALWFTTCSKVAHFEADTLTNSKHTNNPEHNHQCLAASGAVIYCSWMSCNTSGCAAVSFWCLSCSVQQIRPLCRCTLLHCSWDKEAVEGDVLHCRRRGCYRWVEGGENIRWGEWGGGVERCGWNRLARSWLSECLWRSR